jgi:hypothetical protein
MRDMNRINEIRRMNSGNAYYCRIQNCPLLSEALKNQDTGPTEHYITSFCRQIWSSSFRAYKNLQMLRKFEPKKNEAGGLI